MPDLPAAPRPALAPGALDRLAALLPAGTLRLDPAEIEACSRDETEDLRFPPDAVALPATVEEVSIILRWAASERVPVTPQGARTGLSGGALPVRGGLALALERLDQIRRLDVDDMVAEVEVGVTTARLQEAVAEHGLFYPPDPASRAICHLGGNLAEDSAGPHSCKYGTTRRYVLGLEAVLMGGEILRTGGANRKDVTGYNLTQLLVGSEGTLAVFTAATLRLVRQPPAVLVLGLGFPTLEAGAAGVVRIFGSGLEPAACELMEARALELVHRVEPLPPALREAGAFILLELDGESEAELLTAAGRVGDLFPTLEPLVARDPRERRRLWAYRARIGEAVKAHSSYKEVDAVVPRSRLAELVVASRRAARRAGLEAVCYGHAGDGNLHVNLLRGELEVASWTAARDRAESELVAAILDLGGAVSGEHGIGWTQRHHLVRALPPVARKLMQGLKGVFDPQGLLNPDKLLPPEPGHPG